MNVHIFKRFLFSSTLQNFFVLFFSSFPDSFYVNTKDQMEIIHFILIIYLHWNIDQNNHERISQVEEEPDLDRFDVRSAGQGGGHREVDGGQHHHTGDVDSDNQVILRVSGQVVGGLVENVCQDGGQVGYHEDAQVVPSELHSQSQDLHTLRSNH